MKIEAQLEDLKSVAAKLAIDIQYKNFHDKDFQFQSGYCKVNNKDMILLDKELSTKDQIKIILTAFGRFDLDSLYLPPWIRQQLENPFSEKSLS